MPSVIFCLMSKYLAYLPSARPCPRLWGYSHRQDRRGPIFLKLFIYWGKETRKSSSKPMSKCSSFWIRLVLRKGTGGAARSGGHRLNRVICEGLAKEMTFGENSENEEEKGQGEAGRFQG